MNTRFVVEFDFCVGSALGISRHKGDPSRDGFRQCLDPLNDLALLIDQCCIFPVASDHWINESTGFFDPHSPRCSPVGAAQRTGRGRRPSLPEGY